MNLVHAGSAPAISIARSKHIVILPHRASRKPGANQNAIARYAKLPIYCNHYFQKIGPAS
ncbi:hypothetical protein HOE425_330322 [Hoeflea sp. EC-HK425]|nr:hypothetical protein HOE425_330322 [Hoeflea sp. EC-HK425]